MNRRAVASVQLLSLLGLLVCLSSAQKQDTPCNPPKDVGSEVGTCMCQTDNGVIDLNPLANKDGEPRFNHTATDGYVYTYNPCVPYQGGHPCENAYICQSAFGKGAYLVGGSKEQIYQNQSSKTYYVKYFGTPARISQVDLACDQGTEGMITSVKQDAVGSSTTLYTLQLHSCHACPGGCVAAVAPGIVGLVIIFLIPVVVITYFVVGALVLKFQFQATGTDIIPNKTFWLALPFLIKDGCVFTFSPCVKLIRSTKNDYQKI